MIRQHIRTHRTCRFRLSDRIHCGGCGGGRGGGRVIREQAGPRAVVGAGRSVSHHLLVDQLQGQGARRPSRPSRAAAMGGELLHLGARRGWRWPAERSRITSDVTSMSSSDSGGSRNGCPALNPRRVDLELAGQVANVESGLDAHDGCVVLHVANHPARVDQIEPLAREAGRKDAYWDNGEPAAQLQDICGRRRQPGRSRTQTSRESWRCAARRPGPIAGSGSSRLHVRPSWTRSGTAAYPSRGRFRRTR